MTSREIESIEVRPRQGGQEPRSPGRVRLARVAGIDVRLDWSLLAVFSLITLALGAGLFARWHPAWPAALTWGVALGAAVLFFASLLVRELAHALVARRHGISVRALELFVFGGVPETEQEPNSPKAELAIAAVGPLASLCIGLLASLAGSWLAGPSLEAALQRGEPAAVAQAFGQVGPLATLCLWLGPVNFLLAAFNLIPGFPLDGGRVLRSTLWWLTGDRTRATRWACGAGQMFAWLLVLWGVVQMFGGELGPGLWLVLIGWFLNDAAKGSYERLLLYRALDRVTVADAMRTRIERVAPEELAEALVHRYSVATDQRLFPVESEGRTLGIVRFEDLERLPRDQWGRARARELMLPLASLPAVTPETSAEGALQAMSKRDLEQIPVVDGPRVAGLLAHSDLLRRAQLQADPPASSR